VRGCTLRAGVRACVTMSGGWRDSRVNVVDKIELTNNVLITPTMFMFICAR